MKSYDVGVILSTNYVVEANSEDEAEQIALDTAEENYPELNIENTNYVELLGEDNERN